VCQIVSQQRFWRDAAGWWVVGCLLLASGCHLGDRSLPSDTHSQRVSAVGVSDGGDPPPLLGPETRVTRVLAGRATDRLRVELHAGDFVALELTQYDGDVELRVRDSQDQRIREENLDHNPDGHETHCWIAAVTGSYVIEVVSNVAVGLSSRYAIVISRPHAPSPLERQRAEAEALVFRARQLVSSDKPGLSQAVRLQEEAIARFRALGDKRRVALGLNALANSYFYQGKQGEPLRRYEQALAVAHEVGDPLLEAIIGSNLAGMHAEAGDLIPAIEEYRRYLRTIHERHDLVSQGRTELWLANYEESLGDLQAAFEDFSNLRSLYRDQLHDPQGEVSSLILMSGIQRHLGDADRALDALEAAEAHQDVLNLNQRSDIQYFKAMVYLELLNEPETALAYLQRALPLREQLGRPEPVARTLNSMAMASLALGRAAEAATMEERALTLVPEENHGELGARLLTNLGLAEIGTGRLARANGHLGKARALAARLHLVEHEARADNALSRVLRAQGKLGEALVAAQRSLALFESIRARLDARPLRASYFGSVRDYYNSYVDLLMQTPVPRRVDAFEASERSRARMLLEALESTHGALDRELPPALVVERDAAERNLRADELRYRMLLDHAPAPAERHAAEARLDVSLEAYRAVLARVDAARPPSAQWARAQPLSLAELQRNLPEDTALLEYALGDRLSYLWCVTRNGLSSFTLPSRAQLETLARAFYAGLTARNLRPPGESPELRRQRLADADAGLLATGRALARVLLPATAQAHAARRLLVVSDGALAYVPFAALPDPAANDAYRPLLVAHEIAYAPSALVWLTLRRLQPTGRGAPVVFADPVFEADDPRVVQRTPTIARAPLFALRSAKHLGVERFTRLRYSRVEAEAIAQVLGGFIALDFDASRTAATSERVAQARIVHFATHGLLDSRSPELSGLVLSLVDRAGQPVDGFLRLHDIYGLHLGAELVVLSACETALGKEIAGEGMIGLAQGFLYAGAQSVMASLWGIDDRATAELMGGMYRRLLREGMRPATALRAEQLRLGQTAEWRAPYYWAAFQLQGNFE
jgi:CHAT domain-containing protein